MPERAFIIGTGITHFGKGQALRAMSESVFLQAVEDAGIGSSQIDRVYYGNAAAGLMTGQEMVRGQAALRHLDLGESEVINVENACASGSTALMLAWEAVATGRCDTVVAMGAEQLWDSDSDRTFIALKGATDVSEDSDSDGRHSVFMDVYAAEARKYSTDSGSTSEDLAAVAVKNRLHASLNPIAQYRNPQTIEDVLSARMVADPLTLPMCSPITDGAAALVLCSEEVARRNVSGAVEIRAVAMSRVRSSVSPVSEAAARAYELSATGPEDLDLVELHDAAAPAELIQYAEVGLCEEGDGHRLLRKGDTSLGGATPVNTSGGLLSRGHPLGATGCAQVIEIADQLRERAGDRQVPRARVGLAVNGGGWIGGTYAVAVATVLARVAL